MMQPVKVIINCREPSKSLSGDDQDTYCAARVRWIYKHVFAGREREQICVLRVIGSG